MGYSPWGHRVGPNRRGRVPAECGREWPARPVDPWLQGQVGSEWSLGPEAEPADTLGVGVGPGDAKER